MLCYCEYAEKVVAGFSHQINSEYYGFNPFVSIEGIVLIHFSATPLTETEETIQARTRHAVFCYFFSDESKQDSATTIAHSKRTIELLKQRKIMPSTLSTI